MTDAQDILRRAADLIESDGWTRGRYERRGRHCVVGAIMSADSTISGGRAARIRLEAFLGSNGVKGQSLTLWNDAQRSRAPVLKAMRAAADWGSDD